MRSLQPPTITALSQVLYSSPVSPPLLPVSFPMLQLEAFSKANLLLHCCCSNPSAGMGTWDSAKPLVGTVHSITAFQAARGCFQSKTDLSHTTVSAFSQGLQCKHMPTGGGSCVKAHTALFVTVLTGHQPKCLCKLWCRSSVELPLSAMSWANLRNVMLT